MLPLQPPRTLYRHLFAPLCLLGLGTTGFAQQAATPSSESDEEVIVLSPFEVVSDTKGYYSANTMSGTRFNTKIDDLASSVTIVTKEQMNDFAMLDINDVFLYTAGTEGTGTYTDVVIDRNGSVSDNVQINPAQANRVRGIASANVSLNNIETQNRMPIDPIMVDAIEVSRGPNANVFGLGNPSGTVNQVGASANLTRNSVRAELRADDWDGYRESIDVNQVLLKDKLAVRFSQVFNHQESVRKPSGTDEERYNLMVKYRPFKNTTISGAYYYYHMYGNRANALPPRDAITYWKQSGSPTWDPITRTITVNGAKIKNANGTDRVFGASNGNYDGPDYFSSGWLGSLDSQLFINENGDITHWYAPTGAAGANPSTTIQPNRFLQPTSFAGIGNAGTGRGTQPLFATVPSITDKAIYDWSSVNIAAPNRIWDKAEISTFQVDQIFLNTPTQTLAGQFTFFREESERYTRNLIGVANDLGLSGMLTIDVNEKLLDGTPNPYFLRPYISTDKPRTAYAPQKWDTYRGQAAYKYDFTQHNGTIRWLGTHQLTGYYEYKYRVNRQFSYRDVMTSNNPWIPAGLYRGNQTQPAGTPSLIATTRSNYRYYVGDNVGNNVDYAPKDFQYGTYQYVWGNVQTGVMNREQTTLGLGAVTDASVGNNNTAKIILKTYGGVLQSRFWNDSIVTTFGARTDKVYTVFGQVRNPAFLNTDGLTFNYEVANRWESNQWRYNDGNTTNIQVVLRPFKNLPAFRDGGKGFLGDLLSDMSIGFNKSDSFLPAVPAQDLYLNPLPNPTGEDKSFTARFDLFDGKLNISVTRFDNTAVNSRNGDAGTINQRVIRTDLPLSGQTPARFMLYNIAGAYTASSANYNRLGWLRVLNPTWTEQQVREEVANIMKIPTATADALVLNNPPITATNDIQSKGTEVEINYNPTNYWTVAASVEESEVINKNVSPALVRWIEERMAVWPTIKDPLIGAPASTPGAIAPTPGNEAGYWWKQLYPSATQTAEQNFLVFVQQPWAIYRALEGQANPQYSKYRARVSTNFRLAGITSNSWLKKFNVGGAVRWQSRQAIGYYGVQQLPDTIMDVDVNRPIWQKGQYFVDAFVGYKTKLFNDKVSMSLQLNVRNIQEDGHLQKIAAYPNGVAHTFRIVDPRQFILTASFDL